MQNLEKLSVSVLSQDETLSLSGGRQRYETVDHPGALSVQDMIDFGAGVLDGFFGL